MSLDLSNHFAGKVYPGNEERYAQHLEAHLEWFEKEYAKYGDTRSPQFAAERAQLIQDVTDAITDANHQGLLDETVTDTVFYCESIGRKMTFTTKTEFDKQPPAFRPEWN